MADSVDEGIQRYRDAHGIDSTWETRERVVVALTGGPEGEVLIRRAARIAARATGGDLLAVHVARSDGLAGSSVAELSTQRLLVESLGGSYHSIIGEDISEAVLDFARANNATQIVIGASRRNPVVAALTGPGTGMTITRTSGTIDVHVVSHDYVGKGRVAAAHQRRTDPHPPPGGLVVGAVLLAVLVPICAALRSDLPLASDMLLFLLAVVIVSLVGGFYPAFAAAVVASVLLNFYFVPPLHTLVTSPPANVLALVVFVVIASLVSRVVDLAARRTTEAARSNAEAETLSTLAGSLLRGERAAAGVAATRAGDVRDVQRHAAAAREPGPGQRRRRPPAATAAPGCAGSWSCVGSIGDDPCLRPEDGDTEVSVGEGLSLVLRGRALAAGDQRVLAAFAGQVAVAYQQRRLAEAAQAAVPLAEADRMRTALLNALSHDLRTPLASAKIAVSSLRARDVVWTEADQQELLANADAALDQLTALVTDLLDLSRVQAGVLNAMTTRTVPGRRRHPRARTTPLDAANVVGRHAGRPARGAGGRRSARAGHRQPGRERRALQPAGPTGAVGGQHARRAWSNSGSSTAVPAYPQVDREGVFAPFQRRERSPGARRCWGRARPGHRPRVHRRRCGAPSPWRTHPAAVSPRSWRCPPCPDPPEAATGSDARKPEPAQAEA